MTRVKVKKGSGNIFRDLGFAPQEAASLRIRSELMIELSEFIRERGLTQAEAAQLLGVTQPRVSDLVRGKLDLFSVDTLIDMIGRTGGTIRVAVRRAKGGT